MGNCLSDRSGPGKFSTAVTARKNKEYYIKQSHLYFDLISGAKDRSIEKLAYSRWLIRYEWEPWSLLTAQNNGVDTAKLIDSIEPIILPSEIPMDQRYVRFFTTNPFVRMMVRIYWPNRESSTITWIYEEFSFDSNGDISFIEAWSYPESTLSRGGKYGYTIENPSDPLLTSDKANKTNLTDEEKKLCWPDQNQIYRLSTRIPGLGDSDFKPKVLKSGQLSAVEPLTQLDPLIEEAIAKDSKPEVLKKFVNKYRTDFAVQLSQEYDKIMDDPVRKYYNESLGIHKRVQYYKDSLSTKTAKSSRTANDGAGNIKFAEA